MIFELLASVLILTQNVNYNLSSNPSPRTFTVGDSLFTLNEQRAIEREQRISGLDSITDGTKHRISEQIYAEALQMWGSRDEANAVLFIVSKESGFRPDATNGRCHGLFQRLDFTGQTVESQTEDGLKYIQERYKKATKAKEWWIGHKWY